MSKTKISEYSSTAADNTDIGGVNIAEGCPPSSINDAIREQMSQLKEFLDGSSGDTITTAKIVATTAEILSGMSVTGTATFNSSVVLSSTLNATTIDTTNLEVTNLKAKDGTSAGSIADSTGVVTLASVVLTTADINGGTVDGVTLGTNSAVTEAQIDNLNLNGNTISSTNTDGNIVLDPNGDGIVQEDVGGTDFALASQYDIGTAPNEIPLNQYLGDVAYLDSNGFVIQPQASAAPAGIGDMVFQLTSNTSLEIKVKGSDGTVRSVALTLA